MHRKLNIWAMCLFLVFLSGCASKGKFDTVSNDYRHAQEQMSTQEKKIQELIQELQEAEEEKKKLNDQIKTMSTHEIKIKELSQVLQDAEEKKKKLEDQIKTLGKTIQEKETVISIQGKVIKLLDDSEQTLQKSIEAQIAAQNTNTDTPTSE